MDLDEIISIIEAADALQGRLDKLAARQTFTLDRQAAVRQAADGLRGLRAWQLSLLRAAFDAEYAASMERLTRAIKKGTHAEWLDGGE